MTWANLGRATIRDMLRAAISSNQPAPLSVAPPKPPQVHDLRDAPRPKARGRAKGRRKWSQITGITLHQTAVDFGPEPRRMLNVPVHGATLQSGATVLLHDPRDLMWHGNGFNRRDIGIEVSARACGIEGDPRTLWLPKAFKHLQGQDRLDMAIEATDEQLRATRDLVRYYCEQARLNGGRIQYIHAHRQAHSSRVSDPGSRIWAGVGIWAQRELGLKAGPPLFKVGTGNPLPDAWTGKPNGIRYNWQVSGRLD